jgi:hypothetical protein
MASEIAAASDDVSREATCGVRPQECLAPRGWIRKILSRHCIYQRFYCLAHLIPRFYTPVFSVQTLRKGPFLLLEHSPDAAQRLISAFTRVFDALVSAFTRVFDALWGGTPRSPNTKSRKQPHAK